MTSNVENLILEQLRTIRDGVERVNTRIDAVDQRLESLETRVNGISIMMATVIGELGSLDERVETLEGKAQ